LQGRSPRRARRARGRQPARRRLRPDRPPRGRRRGGPRAARLGCPRRKGSGRARWLTTLRAERGAAYHRRPMKRRELIDVAMGKAPADVVVEGGRLVNVATAEIYEADVAVKGDRIAAVGDVAYTKGGETRVIDARGRYV